MLENNQLDAYLEWHNEHVGNESTVFRTQLREFMANLHTLTPEEKMNQMKELLRKE
jgi:hypothetical protein